MKVIYLKEYIPFVSLSPRLSERGTISDGDPRKDLPEVQIKPMVECAIRKGLKVEACMFPKEGRIFIYGERLNDIQLEVVEMILRDVG